MNDVTDRQGWSTESTVDNLSHRPFGMSLANKLALALEEAARHRHLEKRALVNNHRDYCGHGLAYIDGQYHLLHVHDGIADLCASKTASMRVHGAIASWDSQSSFAEFWSKQSNYSCSGADSEAPYFATTDGWKINNQRITRQRIERFLQEHPISA